MTTDKGKETCLFVSFIVCLACVFIGAVGIARFQKAAWEGNLVETQGILVAKNATFEMYSECQENDNGESCCSQDNFFLNYFYAYEYKGISYVNVACSAQSILACTGSDSFLGPWTLSSVNCSVPSFGTNGCPIITLDTNDFEKRVVPSNRTIFLNLDNTSVIFEIDPRINAEKPIGPIFALCLSGVIFLCGCVCLFSSKKDRSSLAVDPNASFYSAING